MKLYKTGGDCLAEEVILYSNDCPKCKILKAKLQTANVKYLEINDIELMIQKGMVFVPMLEVDGNTMSFVEANKWINERGDCYRN